MQHLEQFIYRLHLYRHRPDGYEALTYSYFVMKFALGMVDTFGVIFVFELVNDWVMGLWLVAVYFFLQRALTVVLLVPSGKLLSHLGYRKSMLLALISLAGKIFVFTQISTGELWLFIVAALLGAAHMSLYFLGFHGLFLDDNDDGRIGEQMGYLEMVGRLATVASPFIAGLILQQYGFSWLFFVGVILLLTSCIPLYLMPKHAHSHIRIDASGVWKQVRKNKRFSWALGFMYVQVAVLEVFWPIYMFMIIGSYAAYGSVMSLVMIVSSVVVYGMGRVYDKRPLHRIYPIASLMQAVLWFARFASQTVLSVVAADVLSRISSPMWWMKIRRYELSKGEGMDSVVFGIAHELVLSLGLLAGIVLSMTALVLTGYNWMALSVVAAFGVLLSGWMVRNR